MKKRTFFKFSIGFAILSIGLLLNGCDKDGINSENEDSDCLVQESVPATQGQPMSKVMTIANMRIASDGVSYDVMFNENAEVFTVKDEKIISSFRQAMDSKSLLKVTFNPWEATVIGFTVPSSKEISLAKAKQIVKSPGYALKINLENEAKGDFDNIERISILNKTTPGLTNIVPDMATAQLMFDYISKQCCAIPGPYAIDYCISFQYAHNGTYYLK